MSRPERVDYCRLAIVLGLGSFLFIFASGCVSQAVYKQVSEEKDDLATELARVQLERDSLEQQYYAAQESYEDERITRTTLATDL